MINTTDRREEKRVVILHKACILHHTKRKHTVSRGERQSEQTFFRKQLFHVWNHTPCDRPVKYIQMTNWRIKSLLFTLFTTENPRFWKSINFKAYHSYFHKSFPAWSLAVLCLLILSVPLWSHKPLYTLKTG